MFFPPCTASASHHRGPSTESPALILASGPRPAPHSGSPGCRCQVCLAFTTVVKPQPLATTWPSSVRRHEPFLGPQVPIALGGGAGDHVPRDCSQVHSAGRAGWGEGLVPYSVCSVKFIIVREASVPGPVLWVLRSIELTSKSWSGFI